MSDYQFHVVPLDAADDDPRWKAYFEATRLGFHQGFSSDEVQKIFRDISRADEQKLRYATTSRPTVAADLPVATFTSFTRHINVGHGRLLPASYISDVTVRASDRRQGLLRRMLGDELAAAKAAGLAFATLGVSEWHLWPVWVWGVDDAG